MKKKQVIELHKQGKTLKEIARIVHMSFRDISKIIKVYERKITLEEKKGEINHSSRIKKISKSSQAFKLFSESEKPTEVAIDLDIPFEKTKILGSVFKLRKNGRMINMNNIDLLKELSIQSQR